MNDNNEQKRLGKNDLITEANRKEKERNKVPIKLMMKMEPFGTFIPLVPYAKLIIKESSTRTNGNNTVVNIPSPILINDIYKFLSVQKPRNSFFILFI